jgi:hypothetical protein
MVGKITELPVGKYDAVRTLRHLLQQAESGQVTNVICITYEGCEDDEHNDCEIMCASWSNMSRNEILWGARWFNSWLNNRYFARYHEPDDDG